MTKCIELPDPPDIPIPLPFSVVPPEIALPGFAANICCKLVALKALKLKVPIPAAVVNPAFCAGIRAGRAAIAAYKAQLQPPCPRSSK